MTTPPKYTYREENILINSIQHLILNQKKKDTKIKSDNLIIKILIQSILEEFVMVGFY